MVYHRFKYSYINIYYWSESKTGIKLADLLYSSVVWIMSVIPGGLQGRSRTTKRDAAPGNRTTLSLSPFYLSLLTFFFKMRKEK